MATAVNGSNCDDAEQQQRREQEVISEQLTNELLFLDDWSYVHVWLRHGFNDKTYFIPAGSSVEGASLARNAKDYKDREMEVDIMRVTGWVSSAQDDVGDVLVRVEDSVEHVLVTYPHPQLHVAPREVKVQEECGSSWLNGWKLKLWLQAAQREVKYVVTVPGRTSSLTGPSLATTAPGKPVSAAHSVLEEIIESGSSVVSRCRQLLGAVPLTVGVGVQHLLQLEIMTRRVLSVTKEFSEIISVIRIQHMSQSIVELLTADVVKLKNTCIRLLRCCDPIAMLKDELSPIISHVERGIEILKMCYTQNMDSSASFDNVLSVHVSFWPQQAMGWITRPRQWPSDEVIQQVVDQGFHLVSKPRAHLPAADTECDWRISFSLSEQIMARARSPRQKKVYYLLKVVYYKYLKPIGSSDTSLKSYACKTVMLWVSEEQDVRWWEENSTLTALTHLLKRLLKCLQERRMSYYFIPEVNLFDGWKTPQRVIDMCAAVIVDLIDKPHQCIKRNMDILAHRLLDYWCGLMPHDAQKLVKFCLAVKTQIHALLSMYTSTASRVILPRGGQCERVHDVYEHLMEMVQPGGPVAADEGTSLHDRIRDITMAVTLGDSTEVAESYFTFIWKAGLLRAVRLFFDVLRGDERCVDDPVMLEICKRSRQLVELMLPPHVLCDARVFGDPVQHVTHRSLGNTRLIKHFISVIDRLRQACRDIDGILLWIMISYVIDNMIHT